MQVEIFKKTLKLFETFKTCLEKEQINTKEYINSMSYLGHLLLLGMNGFTYIIDVSYILKITLVEVLKPLTNIHLNMLIKTTIGHITGIVFLHPRGLGWPSGRG